MNRNLLSGNMCYVRLLATSAFVIFSSHIQAQSLDQNSHKAIGKAPRPKALLSGTDSVAHSVAGILAHPRLIPQDADLRVVEFTWSVLPKGHDYFGPFVMHSDSLSNALKSHIPDFAPGSVMFFENIKFVKQNNDTLIGDALLVHIR